MAQKISQDVLFYLRGDSVIDLAPNPTSTITNGNPTINSTNPSFYFNGTSSYLKVTGLNYSTILSKDFTLEFEVNHTSIIKQWATPLAIVKDEGGTTNERTLLSHWMSEGTLTFRDVGGDTAEFTKTGLTFNRWYHIAIVRNGTNISTYFDGTLLSSRSVSGLYTGSNNMYIGTMSLNGSTYFNGYMKNIMLTNGAKYTSNFTPTFDTYTSLDITNVTFNDREMTFNVEKNAQESMKKVEVLINGSVVYNTNDVNVIYNIPEQYTGKINVELRAYYLDNAFINYVTNYNIPNSYQIEKLHDDASILDIKNKISELKDLYLTLNDDMYNYLINENIEVDEDEKKLTQLVEKLKSMSSIHSEQIATLNSTITSKNNEIATLNSTITSKNNEINTLNSTITSKNNEINTLKNTISQFAVQFASYTVSSISSTTYGFSLPNGYYESQNKGVNSSFAICKVTITNPYGANVYMDYINYAEANYDYGLVSKLNTTLTSSSTADTSNVLLNCKSNSSASSKTLDLGKVEGYYYVKFIKDSSQHKNNDSFKFTIRFA
jgi:hypothetical protein